MWSSCSRSTWFCQRNPSFQPRRSIIIPFLKTLSICSKYQKTHEVLLPNSKTYYFVFLPKTRKVSIQLLRSAVLDNIIMLRFSVHRTAEVRSFMGTFWRDRKVSIELLRYAVLWKLLWRVRKVSIKLLRSAVLKLGPKSVHRTAEVRSSRGPPYRGGPKSVHKTAKVRSSMGKNVEGPKSVHRTAEVRSSRVCP